MAVPIAIVGEFDANRKSHRQTAAALGHLEGVTAACVPTAEIDALSERLAREHGVPLVGT